MSAPRRDKHAIIDDLRGICYKVSSARLSPEGTSYQRDERDDYEEHLRTTTPAGERYLNVRVEFHTAEVQAVEAYLAWDRSRKPPAFAGQPSSSRANGTGRYPSRRARKSRR